MDKSAKCDESYLLIGPSRVTSYRYYKSIS